MRPLQIAEEGLGASIDPATRVLRFAAEGAGAARSAAEAEAEVARLEAELQVRQRCSRVLWRGPVPVS